MKTLHMLLVAAAATAFAVTGCSKSEKAPTSADINGVTVDLPKLNQTFDSASPEIKSLVTQVGFNIRYGKYEDSLMALDKLANDPNVTEPQKKVVNDVIEQVKKLANAAPAAAPAQ